MQVLLLVDGREVYTQQGRQGRIAALDAHLATVRSAVLASTRVGAATWDACGLQMHWIWVAACRGSCAV